VEFFKDDTTRRCGQCGHRFVNPKMDFGCAAYCQYAEQCLGDLPPELAAQQEDLLKDRVAIAVKRHLKTDFKRIGHITRRARHAEAIAKESDANAKLPVVLITAFLWDIDPVEGEQETSAARSILNDLNAPPPLIEKVCKILSLRNASQSDGVDTEFKIVADAEQQALSEERADADA
jgi:HD superfamily phosphodiesterase